MMLRQSVPGGVPIWQPAIGLVGLMLFTLLSIWVGSRIFRIAILLKGKTPGFATLIRWAIRG
jgi:ABC-2 type transport system permease protein